MIQFTRPENLNGAELVKELNDNGIEVTGKPFLDGNNDLWLDINESDKAQAESIVAAHNSTTVAPEPSIQDKLANAGITLDELKVALGL
jgi:hypothetical protein